MLSLIAVGVLVIHGVWCLTCKRVSDGVLGKLLYLAVSLAALSYISNPGPHAQDLLNASLAAIAARHWFMKTFWSRILSAHPRIKRTGCDEFSRNPKQQPRKH